MTKTDQILPLTRVVAFLIIPFLVSAFFILYVQSEETGERFAWQIDSRLTAAMMGAGYLGGAYFFLRVGLSNRWHRVAAGFLPVGVYTSFMLVASLLHWNNPFNPGHWPFEVWLVLYIVTPVLIPLLWRWNQRVGIVGSGEWGVGDEYIASGEWRVASGNQERDSGMPGVGEREVPVVVRRAMMVVGGAILLAAVLIFIFPTVAINIWPWMLTPLTARVMAGWQALLGAGALAIARDGRWSAWPIALQSIGLWQVLVVVAFFLHRAEFGANGLLNWFVLYTVAGLIAIGTLALVMNDRRPRAGRQV